METTKVDLEAQKKDEERPFVVWDTYEITKHQVEFLREEDPELSEDDAWQDAQGDVDLFDHEWEYITEYLTEKMQEIGEGFWFASVEDFGWRNLSGTKKFTAEDGNTLLREVLPDCECMFRIFLREDKEDGKHFYIHNFHHDSPMGESYYIYPLSSAKFYDEEDEEQEEE